MASSRSEIQCSLCGNPETEVLYGLPHVWHQPPDSGKIFVRWCDGCHAGFVDPQPSPARLTAFYGSNYFGTYRTSKSENARAGLTKLVWRVLTHMAWRLDRGCALTPEFLRRFVPAGSSVCDLGCGPGHLLKELQDAGFAACGVEPDPDAVKLCAGQGLEVYEGSAEALPSEVRERKFDAVVMRQVLEHCRDPFHALQAAVALLRSGGHLIVEVPNAESAAASEFGAAWFHADVGRHLYFFTPQSLAALTERAGTQLVDTVFSEYTVQFMPDQLLAEQQVWDALHQRGARVLGRDKRRPSLLQRCRLLARTAAAPPERKYGVVALVTKVAPTSSLTST